MWEYSTVVYNILVVRNQLYFHIDMKICINCRTVNMTNCIILQVCILYNICKKGQEPKQAK